jgi:hypothetical protein
MSVKVLIPLGGQEALLLKNNIPNPIQFNLGITVILGQGNGRQPELAGRTTFINMNMRRLGGFMAVKIKLKALLPQYRRHQRRLRRHRAQARSLPLEKAARLKYACPLFTFSFFSFIFAFSAFFCG